MTPDQTKTLCEWNPKFNDYQWRKSWAIVLHVAGIRKARNGAEIVSITNQKGRTLNGRL